MGRAYLDDLRERVVRAVIKWPFAASGGGPIWSGYQHGDQLGPALSRDRQRQAGPDWRLSAKEDCWTASRLAGATMPGSGFYRAHSPSVA
jgi:hypothetical protein